MAQSRSNSEREYGPESMNVFALKKIFMHLPADQLISMCRLVCRKWKFVVDNVTFWEQRCHREGLKPQNTDITLKEWQTYYILCKNPCNLLKNPKAEDDFTNWEILPNGAGPWQRITTPSHNSDDPVGHYFSFFGSCLKSQLINLVQEGYSAKLLDDEQPNIVISDWYAPVLYYPGRYYILVELLNSEQQTIQRFQDQAATSLQRNDQQWNQMTHIFKNYGPGLRYIRFTHGGKVIMDNINGMSIGISVTKSSVVVDLESKT